jgi:hypothetical protein
MNTNNDIELHELETIEQRLNTEGGGANHERAAINSGSSVANTPDSSFEMA